MDGDLGWRIGMEIRDGDLGWRTEQNRTVLFMATNLSATNIFWPEKISAPNFALGAVVPL